MSLSTITTSVVTGGSNSHATTSYEVNGFATDFVGQGIVGPPTNTLGVAPSTGAFAVNAQGSPAMFVDVTAGVAWITATPSGQASQSLRAYMPSNSTSYAISANSSGVTKYDWIYLQVDPAKAANPASDASDVTALYTSRSSSNTADNGSPPAYGIPLAIVTVVNGASSITNANVRDKRTQVVPSAQVSATGNGWSAAATPPTTITAVGNRSYTCVFNSTDLTSFLSKGMRLMFTRTSAAPTQSAALNGSSQYFNKTSPAGMTFTNNFVASAWVKPTSYGASIAIVSRYNGTSGWTFYIDGNGRLSLIGRNAGSTNVSYVQSNQTIPLNKWTHVAAQLDMATFTATPTTSYTMIDGVDVPATVTRGGTNPTALIQAGNLEVGSENGGSIPFAGDLAQVAVYNAKVTQANILKTISQSLVGTETSLISAYTLSNSVSDLNSNANNLTAQGSAVTTNVDNPFSDDTIGSVTYGIITNAVFSTNTTLTVQVPEGANIPTTGGVSAISYSSTAVPYGFTEIIKFELSAWDTSGTLTNPIITAMIKYVTPTPIRNLLWFNQGTATGTFQLFVNGYDRRLAGGTGQMSLSSASQAIYAVTFPVNFYSVAPLGMVSTTQQGASVDTAAVGNASPTTSGWNISFQTTGGSLTATGYGHYQVYSSVANS